VESRSDILAAPRPKIENQLVPNAELTPRAHLPAMLSDFRWTGEFCPRYVQSNMKPAIPLLGGVWRASAPATTDSIYGRNVKHSPADFGEKSVTTRKQALKLLGDTAGSSFASDETRSLRSRETLHPPVPSTLLRPCPKCRAEAFEALYKLRDRQTFCITGRLPHEIRDNRRE